MSNISWSILSLVINGNTQHLDVTYNPTQQTATVNVEGTELVLFSTVGMTFGEIARRFRASTVYTTGSTHLIKEFNEFLSSKGLERDCGFEALKGNCKILMDEINHIDLPKMTKVKGNDTFGIDPYTSRFGHSASPDEWVKGVHQVKGGSKHIIISCTKYNYSTDKNERRFVVGKKGISTPIGVYPTLKEAKQKILLLEG